MTTSCTEDELSNTSVVTEDIIFVSGEVVRLTGRVLSIGGAKVDDHGFVIADNEGFTSPITISLGEKTIPGRFVGESVELELETTYYSRSFVSVGGELIYGNTRTFTTLGFTIIDFSPKTALPGTKLSVIGTNFPADTKVFFDGSAAAIEAINFESEIVLTVPEIGNSESISISVQVGDQTAAFSDNFEYVFGKWQKEGNFFEDGIQYHETVSFQEGNEFVFGLGRDFDFNANQRMFSLDMPTLQWSEITFPGTSARTPFVSGNLFGSGSNGFGPFERVLNEFWQYTGGGTFVSRGALPFALNKSVAFTVNGQLHVTGGMLIDRSGNTNIYRFNEVTGNWIIVGQAPYEILSDHPHFVSGSNVYFISPDAEVWEYTPATGTWNVVSNVPTLVTTDGVAAVINGKAYIGIFKGNPEILEFDPTNYTWKAKVDFTGNPSDETAGLFVYNNKMYILQSADRGGLGFIDPEMELWSFDPAALK